MNRFAGIAVVSLVVLVMLVGLYAGGYWLWVRPCHVGSYRSRPVYYFGDAAAGRALRILYAPVLFYESAKVADGDWTEEWVQEYHPKSQSTTQRPIVPFSP